MSFTMAASRKKQTASLRRPALARKRTRLQRGNWEFIELLEDRRLLSAVHTTMSTRASLSALFTRAAPGVIPPSGLSITAGMTAPTVLAPYTATGTFSDSDSTSWSVFVDWGDGTQINPDQQTIGITSTSFTLNHQYTVTGPEAVSVTVVDADGNSSPTDNFTVVVGSGTSGVAPSNDQITQGTPAPDLTNPYVATGTFTDPDSTSWVVTTDYGDGTALQTQNITTTSFSLRHLYKTGGNQTVSVQITDAQGNRSIPDLVNVDVTAPPVTVATIPIKTLTEPNGLLDTVGFFTDAGPGPWTVAVNYGDGSNVVTTSTSARSFTLDHEYDVTQSAIDQGVVTVTDTTSGAVGTGGFGVDTVNVGPSQIQLQDGSLAQASIVPFTATGTFVDPGSNIGVGAAATDSWTVTINYGDTFQGGGGGFGGGGGGGGGQNMNTQTENVTTPTFTLSHLYNTAGAYTVTVTVTDAGGDSTSSIFTAPVQGTDNPVVTAIGPTKPLKEGHTTLNDNKSFFTDTLVGPYTATVDYGDLTGPQVIPFNPTTKILPLRHTYPSGFNAVYKVMITIGTASGAGVGSFTVTTRNDKPHNLSVRAPKTEVPTTETPFSAHIAFTDAGAGLGDLFRVYVDYYGDGKHIDRASTQHDHFGISHQYARKGTYTVIVTVFDASGAGVSQTERINVFAAPKKKKKAEASVKRALSIAPDVTVLPPATGAGADS